AGPPMPQPTSGTITRQNDRRGHLRGGIADGRVCRRPGRANALAAQNAELERQLMEVRRERDDVFAGFHEYREAVDARRDVHDRSRRMDRMLPATGRLV